MRRIARNDNAHGQAQTPREKSGSSSKPARASPSILGASYMTLAGHRLFTLRMECRLEAQQAAVQAPRDAADDDDCGLSDDDDSNDLEER